MSKEVLCCEGYTTQMTPTNPRQRPPEPERPVRDHRYSHDVTVVEVRRSGEPLPQSAAVPRPAAEQGLPRSAS